MRLAAGGSKSAVLLHSRHHQGAPQLQTCPHIQLLLCDVHGSLPSDAPVRQTCVWTAPRGFSGAVHQHPAEAGLGSG
jgi:hypothetical protein